MAVTWGSSARYQGRGGKWHHWREWVVWYQPQVEDGCSCHCHQGYWSSNTPPQKPRAPMKPAETCFVYFLVIDTWSKKLTVSHPCLKSLWSSIGTWVSHIVFSFFGRRGGMLLSGPGMGQWPAPRFSCCSFCCEEGKKQKLATCYTLTEYQVYQISPSHSIAKSRFISTFPFAFICLQGRRGIQISTLLFSVGALVWWEGEGECLLLCRASKWR